MQNFDFCAPTRIVFGRNTQKQIGRLLKPHAKKILLHYGGGSIKKSGLYDEITTSLKSAGISLVELGGVVPNPRLSLVEQGIGLCKQEHVDLVLAVGGGSVIDSAKAIAMGVYHQGDVWNIFEQALPIQQALPVATVLTIPAAGSESSGDTVVTNEKTQRKLGYGSPLLRPLLSVINPELFFTLPKEQTANGAADMMSHIFERYFTNTMHTDLTDGLCEATLKAIMKNAMVAFNDPKNYDAWAELGFGGTVAHNGLLGMGREQDWACHGMEHELSALYDIPHGAGLAILTPAWMTYVFRQNPGMFVQFAVNVMGLEASIRDPNTIILESIARLRDFFSKLGLPSTLSEVGIGTESLELMAKRATGAAYGKEHGLGQFKKLLWQDVLEIYKMVK